MSESLTGRRDFVAGPRAVAMAGCTKPSRDDNSAPIAPAASSGLLAAKHLPTSVTICGCDSLAVLDQALKAAYSFQRSPAEQIAELLARTASTSSHPEWLG